MHAHVIKLNQLDEICCGLRESLNGTDDRKHESWEGAESMLVAGNSLLPWPINVEYAFCCEDRHDPQLNVLTRTVDSLKI